MKESFWYNTINDYSLLNEAPLNLPNRKFIADKFGLFIEKFISYKNCSVDIFIHAKIDMFRLYTRFFYWFFKINLAIGNFYVSQINWSKMNSSAECPEYMENINKS